MGVGTCAHTDFLKASKQALNLAMAHFVETRAVDASFLTENPIRQVSKPSKATKTCKNAGPKKKQPNQKVQGFRIINIYYGLQTKLDSQCWHHFINHVLSSPIGATIEVVLATQCTAVGSPEGKPLGGSVSLALFDIPPSITILPLTIPIEDHTAAPALGNKGKSSDMPLRKMQPPSQGVITLPSALSQHWTSISGRKCLAVVHLKESITSDHVLPGLRRFLPKSQIIGAGGAFECFVWTRNEDHSSKSPNVYSNRLSQHRSSGKQCNSTESMNGKKAAMTGILMIPKVDLDPIENVDFAKHWLKLHKAAKIVSGIHIIGDPLLVTSVQGRLITSLNNVHPLSALLSTTSHHHAIGQTLALGKFIKKKRHDFPVLDTNESSSYSRSHLSRGRVASLSRAMINTEDDLTDRKSIEDIYPIAIRVTKNGELDSLLPIEPGDEIAILRVDNETERIRFKNTFPLNINAMGRNVQDGKVSVHKAKPSGGQAVKEPSKSNTSTKNESPIWGFTCDSFISRDYSCWNVWNQLGHTSHGGHFRFQIFNGHEYHCSTSWCEIAPNH
ncbi:hypothetical protein XU18_0894 [Perkinsela sp. CCAP 1560/4]|nr:hypothetical protein XU18_1688 [Perkinsela sp. CCAP 1560/4]KNH08608.1 hypothetical protein XU18_0894 [Perkinsela sp. CCAP 1560/4]|eukprot:KNH07594.1 hypothetical protein XU18_1688 [Perkinsela sp. CCAP 1560/4]